MLVLWMMRSSHSMFCLAIGLISFSRVGFNAKEDQALVSMDFVCGELCGAGGTYLLEKEEGVWVVKQTLTAWIS